MTDIIVDTDLASQLVEQFDEFHRKTIYPLDVAIESGYYRDVLEHIEEPLPRAVVPKGIPVFTPSGADKCPRELYYKVTGIKTDRIPNIPYHKRWTRNATLVHEGVQKDLLYMEKYLKDPAFVVKRTINGKPAWEESIKTTTVRRVGDVEYGITGMMDGHLVHTPTGQIIGFEFKTKSNSIAQVGSYKMKSPSDSHITQCTAYSLLYGLDDYIVLYEALAKDGWMKGEDARHDLRAFHITITDGERKALDDKFAKVARAVKEQKLPARDVTKCLFCGYKTTCSKN